MDAGHWPAPRPAKGREERLGIRQVHARLTALYGLEEPTPASPADEPTSPQGRLVQPRGRVEHLSRVRGT